MLMLTFESSAKPVSVAVCRDGELLGQYFQNNGLTHSRTLIAMAESLLKNLDLKALEIDVVAVSRGPGSFTGVRIGVSAAKGFAMGIDKPVCGVSTLEAMAYQAPEPGVILCPVMDARRNQVYNALFEWRGGVLIRLCEDCVISLEDLASNLLLMSGFPLSSLSDQLAATNAQLSVTGSLSPYPAPESQISDSTPDRRPIILIGDGALISYGYFSAGGVACRLAPPLLRNQTAYGVALAAANATPIPAAELEPGYLRPSQAEREREDRGQIN